MLALWLAPVVDTGVIGVRDGEVALPPRAIREMVKMD